MRRILLAVASVGVVALATLVPGNLAIARDRRLPSGLASNDLVQISATDFDANQLKEMVGSDFGGSFVVIEVTVTPAAGKPYDIHLDDFLLRSAQTGDHSGPLAASQIAGSETLVVQRTQHSGGSTGFGGFGGIMMGGMGGGNSIPIENNKAEIKESGKKDPMVDVLKRKILAEKTITEPETGLLFFPLEKEKAKNLTLICSTATGKLRVRFK